MGGMDDSKAGWKRRSVGVGEGGDRVPLDRSSLEMIRATGSFGPSLRLRLADADGGGLATVPFQKIVAICESDALGEDGERVFSMWVHLVGGVRLRVSGACHARLREFLEALDPFEAYRDGE